MLKEGGDESRYLVGGGKMIGAAGARAVAGASQRGAGRDRGTRVRQYVATVM